MLLLVGLGLVASVAAIIASAKNPAFLDAAGHFYGHDFINYWAAPQIAREHLAALFDVELYNEAKRLLYGADTVRHTWSYPPHALMMFAPLGALPYQWSLALWSGLGAGLLVYVASRGAVTHAGWCAFCVLASPALLLNLFLGQNGALSGSLFLIALLMCRARPVASGVALGLLTIKPQLGVVWPVLLLAQRRWQVILIGALTTLILVTISVAAYGLDAWKRFFSETLVYQSSLVARVEGRTYEPMMASWPLTLQQWGIASELAFGLHFSIAALVLATLYRSARTQASFSLQALRLTSAAIVVTPYVFNYDMTAFTVAIIWHLLTTDPGHIRRLSYALGYLLPALVYWFYFFLPLAPLVPLLVYILALREQSNNGRAHTIAAQ